MDDYLRLILWAGPCLSALFFAIGIAGCDLSIPPADAGAVPEASSDDDPEGGDSASVEAGAQVPEASVRSGPTGAPGVGGGPGKHTMLMNRIGPTKSELYVANADGTEERKLLETSGFDYHATYSYDGQWIVFTGEREGLGQADIFRVHPDGTGLQQLTRHSAFDDQGALSPDGTQLAFVSTRETMRANVWILDLPSGNLRNLTGQQDIQGEPVKPDGFFKPSWSPDGEWIAFTSDRNTEWKGHNNGQGWEHVQELGVYIVRPGGSGLRRVTESGVCSGSPKWSADGKRLVFYEMSVETTWNSRISFLSAAATSQIVSIDLETGERSELTSGPGLKLTPQFLPDDSIGFMTRAGMNHGIAYSQGSAAFPASLRSPAWSPDGRHVVYEQVGFKPHPQNQLLYSWDPEYEYRYTDVFPQFSRDGALVLTAKDVDSSVVTMDAGGQNRKIVFRSTTECASAGATAGETEMTCGATAGAAFQPSWSPDGEWIAFGHGSFLQGRRAGTAKIMMVRRDGTQAQDLSFGAPNAGFPSWSPDGNEIVFRSWGEGAGQLGLRVLNMEDLTVRVLTEVPDNVPAWSPDGELIVFTRKVDDNFDIFTIRPDGSNLQRLTTFPANDAHAVWSWDGKSILWASGEYGFRDEAALYDHSFQPYGSIWIMNADGSRKRQLTDSHWEDSMPAIVPPKAAK